jgi:hypothetical protein
MENFEGIGESCTDAVRRWLVDTDAGNAPGGYKDQRYSSSEARRVATEAHDFVEAAAMLQAWFTDRLTVDPGLPGPFAPVGVALMANALELVNWYEIADELRDKPASPSPPPLT